MKKNYLHLLVGSSTMLFSLSLGSGIFAADEINYNELIENAKSKPVNTPPADIKLFSVK